MNINTKENYINLLCNLLECGSLDLSILKHVEYEWCDIIEELRVNEVNVDLNTLVMGVFDFGKIDISETINERIEELEKLKNDEIISNEELEELEIIKALDVFEDIESFHNYIDTSVYFQNDEKRYVYKKYFSDELDHFEEMTGFMIN